MQPSRDSEAQTITQILGVLPSRSASNSVAIWLCFCGMGDLESHGELYDPASCNSEVDVAGSKVC
jgi:hypothetical protein